jgi:redox-sensing transcriptional repressor
VPIFDIAGFQAMVEREQIHIAVIAVPADAAQQVVDTAVGAGIRAILNFSPGTIQVSPSVKLKNVDLTVSIESLSFFLARGEADGTNV